VRMKIRMDLMSDRDRGGITFRRTDARRERS
jgi:hypothetical protein